MNTSDKPVDQLDTDVATLVACQAAKLRRFDPRMARKPIYTARLPVARIAGIDDHDFMEIAAEPERCSESGGPAADDRDVEVHGRTEGTTNARARESGIGTRESKTLRMPLSRRDE